MNKKMKTVILCFIVAIVVACLGIGLIACNGGQNQDGSNQRPPITGDNEPPTEEDKYVTINSLWNEFFSDTVFDDDLQTAYSVICEKAFPDLDAKLEDEHYSSSTNTVNLTVSYY